ncbi:TadE-like protein [Methylophilus rhizosphaerae]|uniref:TadE-like protein n=1 Tax=Methylophilus rhizosphaerae TaxID=492660 RepID=A0A1G9A3I4_9PROT|nr:TadE/TadG family type IV pilus assembly protein [Methylophilus rhizosphaerae]SDK21876.1 TadE-like protein [Methylophilus rhizosphaerae]
MTSKRMSDLLRSKPQKGAVAIEFAMLFLLFFGLFYAMVSYAVVMLMQSAFVHAAEEGARAAIAVDRLAYANNAAYLGNGVDPQVRRVVGNALGWLPAKPRGKVLGTGGNGVQLSMNGNQLTVRVVYSNYASDPVLPMLILPVIGQIPKVPADLAGVAVVEL